MSRGRTPKHAPRPVSRVMLRLLLIAVGGLFALNAITFLAGSWSLIRYPFELDYGEGIVLWQAARVFDLRDAYHPIEQYPFIVFHYPPVYHVLSRAAAMVTGDLLVGGRLVSWVVAVALAVLSGLTASIAVSRSGVNRVAATVVTPLLIFQLATFEWVPFMRVDATAVFFTVLGLFVFVRAASRAGLLAAGALFVIAMFCKQTMVAAPIAAVATLLVTGGIGDAIALGGAMVVLGGTTLGTLTWWTAGEFPRHLFLYNRNPFVLRQLVEFVLKNVADVGVVAGLALIAPFTAKRVTAMRATDGREPHASRWRIASASDRAQRAKICLTVFFFAAGAVCVIAGKVGASINYFLEWNVACCILAGVTVGELLPRWDARRVRMAGLVVLAMLAGFGFNHLARTANYVTMLRGRDSSLNARASVGTRALAEIKAVAGPVLSDDMVLLSKANKDLAWEPAIITQLAAAGMFDETAAIDRLNAQWFDLIVVRSLDSDPKVFAGGEHLFFSARVRDAIRDAYEVKTKLGHGYTILQPRRGDRAVNDPSATRSAGGAPRPGR